MKRQVFLKISWGTDKVPVQPGALSTLVLSIAHAMRAFSQDLNPNNVLNKHSVNLIAPPGGSYALDKNPGPFFFGNTEHPNDPVAFRALNATMSQSIQARIDTVPAADFRNPGIDLITPSAPSPILEFLPISWSPTVKLPLVAATPDKLKLVQHETVIIGDQTSQNFLRPVSTMFLEKSGLNTKLVNKWNNPKTDTPISVFAAGFGNPGNLLASSFSDFLGGVIDVFFRGEFTLTLDVDTDQYTKDDLYFVALVPEDAGHIVSVYTATPNVGPTGAPTARVGSTLDFSRFTQSAIPVRIPANSPSAAVIGGALIIRLSISFTDLGGVIPNINIPLTAICEAGSSPLSSYDTSFFL